MQKNNSSKPQQHFGMNSNAKCSNPKSFSIETFCLYLVYKTWLSSYTISQRIIASLPFKYLSHQFSLHLLSIVMIQGLRTFPRSLHLFFFFPISIYGYIFPDESFYILVLVKSLPKLGCASQSTIEEVLSSTPKPEIPGPSHCSRFALVNIARYGSPLHVCMLDHFSHVRVCVTQRTVACQTLLSTGFSGQEYCSGLPFCHPEDLVDLGIELTSLMSPAQAGRFFTTSTT